METLGPGIVFRLVLQLPFMLFPTVMGIKQQILLLAALDVLASEE